jgi:MFS family permease
VFFVNIPIGIITILVAQRSLPKDETGHAARTDWLGGATFTVCAATLTYAVVRVDAIGWGATETVILLAIAATTLGAFIAIELRSPAPLLDLSLLRGPLTATLITAALYSASAFATLVYASLWLQTVLNLSPIVAGLVTFPMMVLGFVVSAAGGKRLDAAPTRLVIPGGLALIGAGDLLQVGIGAGSDWPRLILGFVVTGIGVGALAPILASAAMAAVPPQRAGMAAGAVNTARQIGLAFGIATFGSVFAARITHGLASVHHGANIAGQVTSGGANNILAHAPAATRSTLDVTIHSAVASGLSSTFLVAGIAGLGGAALSLLLLSLPTSKPSGSAARGSGSDANPAPRRLQKA